MVGILKWAEIRKEGNVLEIQEWDIVFGQVSCGV